MINQVTHIVINIRDFKNTFSDSEGIFNILNTLNSNVKTNDFIITGIT